MKPRTTLEQWHSLQAVIDHGSFARAAEQLHRSQSSVSYMVNKLQQQLGVQLLRMDGRKARLTATGEALLRQSRRLLDDASQLEQFARHLADGWEAEINLVVDAAFPSELLMQALRAFAPISHGTRVQLDQVILSGATDALLNDRAHIAICHRVPERFLGDLLISVEFIAVAHPDHPLHRQGRPLNNADLSREMQVVVRDSSADRSTDRGWLGAEHRWTVSSLDTAISTISQGLGFGWLPRHQISRELDSGALQPLDLSHGQRYSADLYLVLGDAEHAGPATHTLAELLTRYALQSFDKK